MRIVEVANRLVGAMRLAELIVAIGCAFPLLILSSGNGFAQSADQSHTPQSSTELVLEGIEDWFSSQNQPSIAAIPLATADELKEQNRHAIRSAIIRTCMTVMSNQLADIANRDYGVVRPMTFLVSDDPPINGPAKYYLHFFGPISSMSSLRPVNQIWYRINLLLVVSKRATSLYEYEVRWIASSYAIGAPNDEPPIGRLSMTNDLDVGWLELFIKDVRSRLSQCGREAAAVGFIPSGGEN